MPVSDVNIKDDKKKTKDSMKKIKDYAKNQR